MTKKKLLRVIKDLAFLSEMSGDQQKEWLDTQVNLGKEVFDEKLKNNQLEEEITGLHSACKDFAVRNNELTKQLSNHVQVMAENVTLHKRIEELNSKVEAEIRKQSPSTDTFTAKFSGGAEINLTIPQKQQ